MMSAKNAEPAKRIPITIVLWKRNFSKPRLVCFAWVKPSPPPNALPRPDSDCCKMTPKIRSTERRIWIYGNKAAIEFIAKHYSRWEIKVKVSQVSIVVKGAYRILGFCLSAIQYLYASAQESP